MPTFYPANIPLVNYFFYNFTTIQPGPNLPLAGGFIFFRKDEDHNVEKPTYSDVSNSNNPVVNPNPLPLNDVGAWPLFYAEEGLYYIVITGPDADFDNPIWTLEHVNFEGGAGVASSADNYISNGQFLLHTDLPATDSEEAGEIRAPITDIAWGGWTFERPFDSTATDFVTFKRYDQWSANPTGNPRYAVRVQCTAFDSGDAYKDIRIKFPNVNRFASLTQAYTFAFSGMDEFAGSAPIDLYVIKNFGSGGDPQTETLLTTFNLTSSETDFHYSFLFGANAGKIIGQNNDDYIQLALRLRTDEESDVLFTDVDLLAGNISSPIYPETSARQDIATALGGGFPIPNSDGSDLYLTPRLTQTGWVYDNSEIGEVVTESNISSYVNSLHPSTNKMLAYGNQYPTDSYSPLGIPFARLQAEYWDSTLNLPIYGTGPQYLTAYISALSPATQLRITCNGAAAAINAADGTPATGFTFATIHAGSNYIVNGYRIGTATLFVREGVPGLRPVPTAGTSGFTVTDGLNNANLTHTFFITTIAATTLASKYFTFGSLSGNYYMWFTVDGSGTDPAPGGTGIKVDLKSTYGADEVCSIVLEAIGGRQITTVVTVAGSVVPPGSYFSINTPTPNAFYVWYTVDGNGTDPAPANKTAIKVVILSADTAIQVATKTQIAINQKYFAVPDYESMFLRGISNGSFNDLDNAARWSVNTTYLGDQIGTFQMYGVENHSHDYTVVNGTGTIIQGGATFDLPQVATSSYGGTETRPINAYVNYAIRY